jgi:1,2-diacylglycerol 3-beta-glucosyltransferase
VTSFSAVWVTVASTLVSLPVLAPSVYLAMLSVLSRRRTPKAASSTTHFDVIVPAHNEANGIGATIASLQAVAYPPSQYRILVVADNCTDDTAARAQAAGALVLERSSATERGKGYALEFAYAASMRDGFADAVVVVDADTSVSQNLLSAFSARFAAGADAVQAEYGVRNARDSWRTRLMAIALTLFHEVRSLGRERLGLSAGLRGNGMGFRLDTLRRVPPKAYSIVEDVEYGVSLALAGVRVEYVHEALVQGDMPATADASRSQRERWESGRWSMVKAHVPRLLKAARGGGGVVALDLAADLLVLPLTSLVGLTGVGFVASGVMALLGAVPALAVLPWALAVLGLLIYIGRGIVLSGGGWRTLKDLAWAPAFALWKIALLLKPTGRKGEWVRTTRSDER